MKRKHVATGNPRGGQREGAGRPAGVKNVLPIGSVAAVKSLRLRVPESTPEPLAEVADEAFNAIVGVMRSEAFDPGMASARLRAAAMVREEICGPVKQRVEHSFSEMTDEQLEARSRALVEKRYQEMVSSSASTATKPPEPAE